MRDKMKKTLLITLIAIIIIIPISVGGYHIIKNKKETIHVENNLSRLEDDNDEVTIPLYNIYETEEVTEYVNNASVEVETILEQEQITQQDQQILKNTFITLTDFIFYGKEINGVTFEQLTLTAQEQILILYEEIDYKIEQRYPGYKETIKTNTEQKYNEIKTQLLILHKEIENEIIQQIGLEEYTRQRQKAEENIQIIEDSFEPVVDTTIENINEIYEATKEGFNNWYQTWKEANS